MAEQNLNAQQVAAVRQEVQTSIARVIDGLQLRKWAIETALSATSGPALLKTTPGKNGDAGRVEFALIGVANEIYDFVVKPALEPFSAATAGVSTDQNRG